MNKYWITITPENTSLSRIIHTYTWAESKEAARERVEETMTAQGIWEGCTVTIH